jgi:hypothetical protein
LETGSPGWELLEKVNARDIVVIDNCPIDGCIEFYVFLVIEIDASRTIKVSPGIERGGGKAKNARDKSR